MVNVKLLLAFVVLGLTVCHVLSRVIRLRNTEQFPALAISLFLVSALFLLPVAQVYSGSWRAIAREKGLYDQRRPVQRIVTLAVVSVTPLVGAVVGVWFSRRRPVLFGVIVFSLLVFMLATVKVVSYHPVDAIMAMEVGPGVSLFEAFFASGLLALNACLLGCVRDKVI